jgi:hypothetical protein
MHLYTSSINHVTTNQRECNTLLYNLYYTILSLREIAVKTGLFRVKFL